jgi:hypothetical protein
MKFIKPLWKEAQRKRKKALAHSRNDADAVWQEFWESKGFDPKRFDPKRRIQIQSLRDLTGQKRLAAEELELFQQLQSKNTKPRPGLYSRCFKLGEFKDSKGQRIVFAGR